MRFDECDADSTAGAPMPANVGDVVELRNRFDGSWSSGFEIAAVLVDGYRIRRIHDDSLLPDPTGRRDVRAAPRGSGVFGGGFDR